MATRPTAKSPQTPPHTEDAEQPAPEHVPASMDEVWQTYLAATRGDEAQYQAACDRATAVRQEAANRAIDTYHVSMANADSDYDLAQKAAFVAFGNATADARRIRDAAADVFRGTDTAIHGIQADVNMTVSTNPPASGDYRRAYILAEHGPEVVWQAEGMLSEEQMSDVMYYINRPIEPAAIEPPDIEHGGEVPDETFLASTFEGGSSAELDRTVSDYATQVLPPLPSDRSKARKP